MCLWSVDKQKSDWHKHIGESFIWTSPHHVFFKWNFLFRPHSALVSKLTDENIAGCQTISLFPSQSNTNKIPVGKRRTVQCHCPLRIFSRMPPKDFYQTSTGSTSMTEFTKTLGSHPSHCWKALTDIYKHILKSSLCCIYCLLVPCNPSVLDLPSTRA